MSELPEGWAEAVLGDLIAPIETTDPRRSPTEPFIYVDIGSIDNTSNSITAPKEMLGAEAPSRARRVIRSNDVLFSTVRTYLKNIARVPEHLDGQVTSTGIAVLRAIDEIDPGYLFRLVTSDNFIEEVSRSQDGTLYPAITDKKLAATKVPVAPAPEQKRIAAKIDRLTAKSARARTELIKIESLVERYKASVIDTEIGRAEKAAQSEHSIEEIATSTFDGPFGSNLKSADYVEAGKRVIRLENIGHLAFIGSKETFISKEKFLSLERHHLKADDILFSSFISDNIRVCRLPADLDGQALNKADCFAIRLNREIALPGYIMFALGSTKAYDALSGSVHGATRPRINLKQLKSYALLLPPIATQNAAIARIEAALGHIDQVVQEIRGSAIALDRIDQQILSKAFSGALIPQNTADEPAGSLLERIRLAKQQEARHRRPRRRLVDVGDPAVARREQMAKTLLEALKNTGDWMDAQSLFSAVGIKNGASTDTIELFYAELRTLDEDGLIEWEPVHGGDGKKVTDRIRLKVPAKA